MRSPVLTLQETGWTSGQVPTFWIWDKHLVLPESKTVSLENYKNYKNYKNNRVFYLRRSEFYRYEFRRFCLRRIEIRTQIWVSTSISAQHEIFWSASLKEAYHCRHTHGVEDNIKTELREMVCMSVEKNEDTRPTTVQWRCIANSVIKRRDYPYELKNCYILNIARIVSLYCV
jgi:hypothetical protein